MAVTVVKTPEGHKINSTSISATITDASGDALVTMAYHGLGTGDFIYITSDIDEYNGFWYVTAIDTDTFKISEYSTAAFVEYFQDADIEYYTTLSHDWSSIFLPIVYKLTNDKWPVNTVDTVRTLSAIGNDNGYLEIFTSGSLKTGIKALDYLEITDCVTEEFNGVWQILEVVTATHFVIDAAYSAGAVTGGQVQFYYNNYQVKVKLFAGLPPGHTWQAKKPYEELAELSFTPDNNGLVMFSIAEYIRGKIDIKNNLTLYSLPLNLDAFTGFYISVAEEYDVSDGYTLGTEESAYTDDTFEGFAIAGKLAFKNTYAGDYADYIYVDGAPAMWLTGMSRLIAVEDKYFDISFIKNNPGDFIVRIDKYIADYLVTTETVSYSDQGIGVYRIPITVDAYYDSFCITITSDTTSESISLPTLADWQTRTSDVSLIDWTEGAAPTVSLSGGIATPESSEYLFADYSFINGYTYTITINYTTVSSVILTAIRLRALDDSFNVIASNSDTLVSSGSYSLTLTFTATSTLTKIGINATVPAQNDADITIDSVSASVVAPDISLTEEICINIIESCEAVSGFIPTDIRLTEDGDYRILE